MPAGPGGRGGGLCEGLPAGRRLKGFDREFGVDAMGREGQGRQRVATRAGRGEDSEGDPSQGQDQLSSVGGSSWAVTSHSQSPSSNQTTQRTVIHNVLDWFLNDGSTVFPSHRGTPINFVLTVSI